MTGCCICAAPPKAEELPKPPSLPNLPKPPSLPKAEELPLPKPPSLPSLPNKLPSLPSLPNLPTPDLAPKADTPTTPPPNPPPSPPQETPKVFGGFFSGAAACPPASLCHLPCVQALGLCLQQTIENSAVSLQLCPRDRCNRESFPCSERLGGACVAPEAITATGQ